MEGCSGGLLSGGDAHSVWHHDLADIVVRRGGTVSGVCTLSIAFRHLPPNSARFRYTTEGALFISAQLSSDTVSTL